MQELSFEQLWDVGQMSIKGDMLAVAGGNKLYKFKINRRLSTNSGDVKLSHGESL